MLPACAVTRAHRRLLLCATLCAILLVSHDAQAQVAEETRLKEALLDGYERGVLPPRARRSNGTGYMPLPVEIAINFHRVSHSSFLPPACMPRLRQPTQSVTSELFLSDSIWAMTHCLLTSCLPFQVLSVDVITSTVDILSWIRLRWRDERLAWK